MPSPNGVTLTTLAEKMHSDTLKSLKEKIESRKAVIGIVGLGYVGLPLAVAFASREYQTIGFDINKKRVNDLTTGASYIQDVSSETLRSVVTDGRLVGTDDFAYLGTTDVIFICVPTPVTEYKEPDTTYIESATRAIAEHLHPGQLVILKSTTYPGTTEECVLPLLEEKASERGMAIGRDYALAFSPERVDPGNTRFGTENTPIVVGGVTESCTQLAAAALKRIVDNVHRVSSPRAAEMTKLLENIFRSVNIALVNELACLCERMGDISIWEVIEAAATKPFGFMPFYPGPGLGGHCIPIDPYYLAWVARRYDFETSFLTLSARINEEMPFHVARTILREIAKQPVRLAEARVLILGVAFKKDIDDIRHSPALKIMEILRAQGVEHLNYCDPHVTELEITSHPGAEGCRMKSLDPTKEVLEAHDIVVIITDHSAFDYELLADTSTVIVDTRNALERASGPVGSRVLLGSRIDEQ